MILEAAHGFPSRGKKDVAGLDIPIPDTIITASNGKLPPFFAGPKRIFNLPTFGNVKNGTGHADRTSGRITIYVAASMDKPDFAVRTDDATFHIVDVVSKQRIVDDSHDTVVIVRMQ
jgi:hypothetical protein